MISQSKLLAEETLNFALINQDPMEGEWGSGYYPIECYLLDNN